MGKAHPGREWTEKKIHAMKKSVNDLFMGEDFEIPPNLTRNPSFSVIFIRFLYMFSC